jgi:hypothetical protein
MRKGHELSACFTIQDSFDPAEITRRIGIDPTECWRKGDLHPKSGVKRKLSRWSLFSRLARTAELEDHVKDILAQMDQKPEAFQSVSKEFGGHIQVSGYFNTEEPSFHFDQRTVEALAKYSLSVGFDFYHVHSDGKKEK